ncbi:BrnT family toxin [uncultured Thiodictyon sp.]|uniref:BrnT family toxin n=1 Tax=uncultured Thiodictyon sp. TaxID=1846217 RepID=UPI0025DB9ADD|nr:BrnT family toxin [uncultured Thiodictyon sp.]
MITFDAAKRRANLANHRIDLAACEAVFDGFMSTAEDRRLSYGEQRLQSLGWLVDRVVLLVWVDRPDGPHLISCRAGTKHETQRYFQALDQP